MYFKQNLHGNCDEQHVQALKDDVATVADPDVGAEDHCEECTALQRRECAQSHLTPARPVCGWKTDAVRRWRPCGAVMSSKKHIQIQSKGLYFRFIHIYLIGVQLDLISSWMLSSVVSRLDFTW